MRRLFFGSLAGLACLIMFSVPLITPSSADTLVVPIATITHADYALPLVTPFVENRVMPAALPVYAFARMDRMRTYNDKVRFDFRYTGLNPKPAARYLC